MQRVTVLEQLQVWGRPSSHSCQFGPACAICRSALAVRTVGFAYFNLGGHTLWGQQLALEISQAIYHNLETTRRIAFCGNSRS